MKKGTSTKSMSLRISDVAKASGVSVPTIHYYLREGLLTPPKKTSRNMAYYDPICIEDIRLIKNLQANKFLPLSAIKLILQAKREGQDVGHLTEMRSFLEDLFQPLDTALTTKRLSFNELASITGLSTSTLNKLKASGLLMPAVTKQGTFYNDIDVNIIKMSQKLMEFGVTPDELRVYRQYIDAIRNEAITMHDKIHSLEATGQVRLNEMIKTLNNLKTYLSTKVYRQIATEFHR